MPRRLEDHRHLIVPGDQFEFSSGGRPRIKLPRLARGTKVDETPLRVEGRWAWQPFSNVVGSIFLVVALAGCTAAHSMLSYSAPTHEGAYRSSASNGAPPGNISARSHSIPPSSSHSIPPSSNGMTDADYEENQRRIDSGIVDTSVDSCASGCFEPKNVSD